jgi:RNA-directed DNA polymerase
MDGDLRERLTQFNLQLNEEKTHVLEFGRLPALARRQRGARRLRTFTFLGFTHYCGWSHEGRFIVKRKTEGKRVTAKLNALNEAAKRRQHMPVRAQHRWLCAVLRCHYVYYGLPSNFRALKAFAYQVPRIWFRTLNWRSQRRMTWTDFGALLTRLPLPTPRITHPSLA